MTDDVVPIRGDVPPGLHPEILAPVASVLGVEGTNGPAALAAGREALGAMYRVYAAMEDAEAALHSAAPPASRRQAPDGRSDYLGDLRLRDGVVRRFHGREEEFAEAATQAWARAASTVDRRFAELRTIHAQLSRKIEAALDYPTGRSGEGLAQAQEIRGHLKTMKESERMAFLHEAVEKRDRQTVAAALTAPAFLSGMEAEHLAGVRKRAMTVWAPVDSGQMDAVDVIMDRIMAAAPHLQGRLAKAVANKNSAAGVAATRLSELAGT